MRIAIDARKLHDFGIGTYIRNLVLHLARIDTETDYLLLCAAVRLRGGAAASAGTSGRWSSRPAPTRSASSSGSRWRCGASTSTCSTSRTTSLPPLIHCRSVVTIHDCIHLMFPQYLPNRAAYAYARAQIWAAAKRSERILTVSEASKNDILRRFDVPAEKITVIYNAIDDRLRVAPPDEEMERVRERYQLSGRFVLYVGNIKPHKNLERLIDAFGRLRAAGHDDLKLVIIGDEISRYQGLRRAVHQHKLHGHVRFLGFVPIETLAVLYRLASVFVFPSLYEGFGLPPLEAMASGTPVVTSNISSLPGGRRRRGVPGGSLRSRVDRRRHGACAHRRRVPRRAGGARPRAGAASSRGPTRCGASARSTARCWRTTGAALWRTDRTPARTHEAASLARPHRWARRPRTHRPRARLADGHARRREGARGRSASCTRTPICSRWCTCRGSVSPAIERLPRAPIVAVTAPGARRIYRHLLPLFPVGVEQFDLDALRPGDQLEPLRRQVGGADRPGPPSLLLPHADALRLGPVRGLLRGGPDRPVAERG